MIPLRLNFVSAYLEGPGELEGRLLEVVPDALVRPVALGPAGGPAGDTGLAEVGRPLASGPPPWPQGLC